MKNVLIILCLIAVNACAGNSEKEQAARPDTIKDMEKYNQLAIQAEAYCKQRGLNSDFFYLVDLGQHSGYKRFHLWDFNKSAIVKSYMVSHGCGHLPWSSTYSMEQARFSNHEGSKLSSLGRYIIKERGGSQWGIGVKYLIHGVDATNSNALRRAIVLHSWEQVPDEEIFPKGTPEGWGCPAVSNDSMREIDAMLRKAGANTLMWIVD
ncbi:MAG: murein L,D-transpeptidase catalytic domain-containing protein [Arcticibacter sp.]